jgi:hypothetical protein
VILRNIIISEIFFYKTICHNTIKNNINKIIINNNDRIDLLIDIIKRELIIEYDIFMVKTIQLFYDDDYDIYQSIKEEIITDKVCI